MKSMRNLIGYIIKKLKGYDDYSLDDSLRFVDIISILFRNISRVSYYNLILSFRTKSLKIRFIGKKISLNSSRKIKIGTGCRIGNYVKIDGLSKNGVIIGNASNIDDYTIIQSTSVLNELGEGLVIGNNCGIGSFSFIGCQGGVYIGNDVIIGPGLKVFTENHNFDDPNVLIRLQGTNRNSIVIEDNVWIGANVTILAGTRIHKGAVIAAGSIVTKDVQQSALVAGVPAKYIRKIAVNN